MQDDSAKVRYCPEETGNLPKTSSMRKCSKYCVTCPLLIHVEGSPYYTPADHKPDYLKLYRSGIDDMTEEISGALCLPAAFFLHALGMVRYPREAEEFAAMCRQHVPYWRKRIDPQAWVLIATEIKARLKSLGIATNNSKEG